ncbi:MAG TPA: hypothetical protein VFL51_02135 [Pseudolabrys sp.]|nr:hypothetical protein [Pseudolabrys sp.]
MSPLVHKIYDNVHMTLWSFLIAFALWFIVVMVPNLPEIRARNERVRVQEIAAEHTFYCRKWGFLPRTREYDQCILDLQEFRAKVENRIAQEQGF